MTYCQGIKPLNEKIKMPFTCRQNLKARNYCINSKNINTTTRKCEIKTTTDTQLTTLNQNRGGEGGGGGVLVKIFLSRILLNTQLRMSL